jgi:glycine/D-amino acid oxidase-like deaminating enzyme
VTPLDAVVVGAGIHGLCAAFWLRQAGHSHIAVLDRFGPGHDLGSSHGATRITRSSYHEQEFVRMAHEAHRHAWPALEQALGKSLRVPTPGLFFGPPDGPFGNYLRATMAANDAVQVLATTAARDRFPLLRFDDDDAVLLDHSAAMILAAETMSGLRDWLLANGVEMHWHCPAERIEVHRDSLTITTPNGALRCRSAILAAGADLARLAPELAPTFSVLRQQVGYFSVAAPEEATTAGSFPVWARIGRTANDFQYGLPAHAGAGLKLAQHRTEGPCEAARKPPPIAATTLLALARERFAVPVHELTHAESCLYTMTPGQGLQITASPRTPHLLGIAACNGHGFKFGPVIGRRAAMLLPR